ncbi:MAG: hypothetical protein AAF499_18215 [Pseudomonadota bacterium]
MANRKSPSYYDVKLLRHGLAARTESMLLPRGTGHMEDADTRFTDPGDTVYTLLAEAVWVECPRCAQRATHKPIEGGAPGGVFAPRRLVCAGCSLAREWQKTSLQSNWRQSPARDDYFNAVLWLRESLGRNELWAYNPRHLDLIEQFVAAKHRQRTRDNVLGWANRRFTSRLPAWIKAAKNRQDILKTIERIRVKRMSA